MNPNNWTFKQYLIIFILLNIFLYLFVFLFHGLLPFDRGDYIYNSHHFVQDPRIKNSNSFDFLNALGQEDAQWYLDIASNGYPNHPQNVSLQDKNIINGITYAFFPLYPIVIALVNYPIHNIEVAAFLLANILLFANFSSLYFILYRLFSKNTAIKATFLLFLFPFSIFFRSYFSESLQLLLLIWFSYFLIKRKFVYSAVFLALLNIVKGNDLLLDFVLLFYLSKFLLRHKISFLRFITVGVILSIPFGLWLTYCYIQTGNPLYFYTAFSAWYKFSPVFEPLVYNLIVLLNFYKLPFHSFHFSIVEETIMVGIGVILYLSRKKLPPELWWTSFLLWLTPLITKDLMSFSRYQSVSFPLFVYLSTVLKGTWYWLVVGLFLIGLLLTSIYFVNWYWVG